MIQKEQLSTGNWVTARKWREKPFQLTRINDSGKYYYGTTAEGSQVGPFLIEELEPIALTAEILEKNGFKFESPCINDNKDAWVYEWPNEKSNYTPHAFLLMSHHNKAEFPNFWIYAPNNPEIVYVHELQHALRVCNVDKEIEL